MGLMQFRHFGSVIVLILIGFAACSRALAGGGPENVLVVVNADSPSSSLIANHYIDLRNIPSRNVVYLAGIPDLETVPLDQFLELIFEPLIEQLDQRKLLNIDYVVYSADFPTAITIRPLVDKLASQAKEKGVKFNRSIFGPVASINSLTYFFQHLQATQKGRGGEDLVGLTANYYFRKPSSQVLRAPFLGDLQQEFRQSINSLNRKPDDPIFEKSIGNLEKMAKENPQQMAVFFWLAKFSAKSEDAKAASQWITRAMALGLSEKEIIQKDRVFLSVSDPLFRGLIKRMSNDGNRFAVSRGFKRSYRWGPNGMINREPSQGRQYLLSTVLAVTRNGGNTEKEALKQLKRSVGADFSRPKGAFYFTDTADVRSKTRAKMFPDVTAALKELGYPSRIVKSKIPTNAIDALGMTSGTPGFDLATRNCRIQPGAICENLTSYGGRMLKVGGHTKLSEFLRFGAAGSSGTVTEPRALWQKFPHPMIHVHYARGCSLAESFYQSLSGPFQTLIVGDALCQPFATEPRLSMTGIKPGEEVKDAKRILKFDDSKTPLRVNTMDLYLDGILFRRFNEIRPIELSLESLSDGYHELRAVFVGANRAETTGRVIVPFTVNRKNRKCSLEAAAKNVRLNDAASLDFSCNGATSIRFMHNHRIVHQTEKDTGNVEISASDLGRGPVKIQAIATMPDSEEVASAPVALRVSGKISATRRMTSDGQK